MNHEPVEYLMLSHLLFDLSLNRQ